ncbi:MAG: hypothetical protein KDD90_00570 [Sphingomonadaceae bacterium]|jgi:hypothetical protein|nr:hypothetical protein [Sphingomonadaceae bacterium]
MNTHENASPAPSTTTRRRIPWFFPVPVAERHNAWLPMRQVAFVGLLAQTRSVSAAAHRVGMARQGAYRLRKHPWSASLVAAWDAALGLDTTRAPATLPCPDRKTRVTHDELVWRFEMGLWRPVMRNGQMINFEQKPCTETFFQIVARFDKVAKGLREEDVFGR